MRKIDARIFAMIYFLRNDTNTDWHYGAFENEQHERMNFNKIFQQPRVLYKKCKNENLIN